ncbi:YihY family inner membrane protein [Epidermidibacterium keratini]|uniref:YihY family inner membrane protein n=1 Tax=Epidermidibacterium keratini TaxID=1891644 RepID=A0A7L4YPG5_9ACTN|nr:YihY/virulence factor BrkB family protein [Epidermidibacterium keratini]QHC01010.1 YihY family inner membrane protein [Epidermidibacterium keratini]
MAAEQSLLAQTEYEEKALAYEKRTKWTFAQRRAAWKAALRRAPVEFGRDQSTNLAASLTYYAILAIFPAALALVSLIGVFGNPQTTTDQLLDIVDSVGAGNARETIQPILDQLINSGAAGFALVFGILGAVFSASGYVSGFAIAMNRVYEVTEGRNAIKLKLQQVLITLALIVLAVIVAFSLVVSGDIAQTLGGLVGLGDQAVTVWNFAKLPVILLIVMFMVAMLYYLTPNIQRPKFRLFTLGSVIGVTVWILLSIGFAFYVTNFGRYNKTYGTLAGVIVFLLWIWITNIALLFGAEVDCEVERARQLQLGIKAERRLQLPPRDISAAIAQEERYDKVVAASRHIRQDAERTTRRRLLGRSTADRS